MCLRRPEKQKERRWKVEVYHLCVRLPESLNYLHCAESTPGVLLTGVWICFRGGPVEQEVQLSGRGFLVDLYGKLSLWHLRGIRVISFEEEKQNVATNYTVLFLHVGKKKDYLYCHIKIINFQKELNILHIFKNCLLSCSSFVRVSFITTKYSSLVLVSVYL